MTKLVHVAVGIICNENADVLIAFRHRDKHQGGLWEFPGGKVENGESIDQALGRELKEELGLNVLGISPVLKIEHDYGDKLVLLDVWKIDRYEGQARGMEGQLIKWVGVDRLKDYAFPRANDVIVDFLSGTV